jgi:hypothetical protein
MVHGERERQITNFTEAKIVKDGKKAFAASFKVGIEKYGEVNFLQLVNEELTKYTGTVHKMPGSKRRPADEEDGDD